MKSIHTLFLSLSLSIVSLAEKPTKEHVSKELPAIMSAVYTSDVDLIIKHTPSDVFKLAGGEEGYKKVIAQAGDYFKSANLSFVTAEVSDIKSYTCLLYTSPSPRD